jgi:hypothetical protein
MQLSLQIVQILLEIIYFSVYTMSYNSHERSTKYLIATISLYVLAVAYAFGHTVSFFKEPVANANNVAMPEVR